MTTAIRAYGFDGCENCKWAEADSDGWCYHFHKAPEVLPCTQHDKFEMERLVTTTILKKHPELIRVMIMTVPK